MGAICLGCLIAAAVSQKGCLGRALSQSGVYIHKGPRLFIMRNYTLLNVQATRAHFSLPWWSRSPGRGAFGVSGGLGDGCSPLFSSRSSEPGAPRLCLMDELLARSN